MNGVRSHNKESVLFCEHLNHLMRQHMRRSPSNVFLGLPHRTTGYGLQWLVVMAIVAVAMTSCPRPAKAIEMFTFFGDGSRVPLPSLETPIEAYPGIPLRSDRLRAQRRAAYQAPAGVPVGNGRITIRSMPVDTTDPAYDDSLRPAPAPERIQTPPPSRTRRVRWRKR